MATYAASESPTDTQRANLGPVHLPGQQVQSKVEGIITIDECGNITSLNHAAEKWFGSTAAEIIGKNARLTFPSPFREAHDTYLLNLRIARAMGDVVR